MWESVLLNAVLKHTAVQKRNGLPRPVTSVTGLARTEVVFILPCLLPNGNMSSLATPSALRATVSLRLGHGAALTCPRHVIHYRAAVALP